MKVNAPEKIYLQSLQNNEIYNHWYSLKLNNDFIEYTRTDAFIEKACAFFAPYIQDNSGGYERAAVIEAFKDYMKGE